MTTQLNSKTLYETDFVQWLEATVHLLRDGKLDQLDINNLVEELESIGRSHRYTARHGQCGHLTVATQVRHPCPCLR